VALGRGLRAGGQNAAAFTDGHKIAVHFQFADHFPRGGNFVPFHLLEFVGKEDGSGVGLRREADLQTVRQRTREFTV
jgi:hypothetical protein